ncbi:MAG: CBS domain-containing protein [Acidobacteria bacterium]|nr:CBS domain-containing protein [Acidobacteriota bacterium]
MELDKIMTPHVVTVGMDDELLTIQVLFESFQFHHLLVLGENDVLVGVISDRDLLKHISPFIATLVERPIDLRTLKRKAHQIMSRKSITATKEQSLNDAAALMIENNISCIPIIRRDQTIEGIVSWKDIMKHLVQKGSF